MNKLVSIVLNKVMLLALIINVLVAIVSPSNVVAFEILLTVNTMFVVYITNQRLDKAKVALIYILVQLITVVVIIVGLIQGLPLLLIGLWLTYYWIPKQIIKQLKSGSETKKNIVIALLINLAMVIVMWSIVLSVYHLTRTFILPSIGLSEASIVVVQLSAMIGYIYVVTPNDSKPRLGVLASILYVVLIVVLNIPFMILRPSGEVIEITSCDQLATLNMRGRYQLNTNIDCLGVTVSPTTTNFYGEIIGNGNTISNLELDANLIGGLSYNGKIEGINFENYSGSSIVGTNEGIIKGIEVSDSKITNTEQVGAISEVNNGQIEYITIENSEISGSDSVGAITGVNGGTISGASVASDVKVSGDSRLGTLVGLNQGLIDHSFSSGNIYDTSGAIIDSNQNEYTNDYVGTLVGQQVNHASLKQTVYDGDSYSNSIYREVGVQESIEANTNVVNMCVAEEYADNPTMTIGDYNQLISYSEPEEGGLVKGKCQEQELNNRERRDNYIAEDDYVVTAGNDYEVCVFTYYADEKNTPSAPVTPTCSEEVKAFPLPFPYKASLSIWVATKGYDLWHVDKPTSENYSIIQPQDGVVLDLYNPLALGFGDCWNRDVYPPQLKPYNSDDICLIANS